MSMYSPLAELIADKCVNCHACIAARPVKFCNNGAGDHVFPDPDLRIGRGACLKACTHGARRGVDAAGA